MEWRRWRACNRVRRFQLRRMGDQRWGGGDGKGDRSHGRGGAFGNDLCGAVQRGQGKERKTCPDEGQRCLGIGRYIDAQTWSIMPGAEKSESGVADACAKQLAKTS